MPRPFEPLSPDTEGSRLPTGTRQQQRAHTLSYDTPADAAPLHHLHSASPTRRNIWKLLELRFHLLMNHEAFDWTTAMWAVYNSPIETRGRWNEVEDLRRDGSKVWQGEAGGAGKARH